MRVPASTRPAAVRTKTERRAGDGRRPGSTEKHDDQRQRLRTPGLHHIDHEIAVPNSRGKHQTRQGRAPRRPDFLLVIFIVPDHRRFARVPVRRAHAGVESLTL